MKKPNNMAKRPEQETFEDKLKSIIVFWVVSLFLMPCTGISLGIAVHVFLWIV